MEEPCKRVDRSQDGQAIYHTPLSRLRDERLSAQHEAKFLRWGDVPLEFGQAPRRSAELQTQPDPSAHQKRARATDFDDEETGAAEQQSLKRPRLGGASGEAAMSESDGE